MFEKVNKAYEFLCSKSKVTEGPDPKNIVLILKGQSILFSRYKDSKYFTLLPTGSEERGVLGVESIPVAILPSCQDMTTIA